MILKVILFALCANLLWTNANLMLELCSGLPTGLKWGVVGFALTYSLISTLSLYKLSSLFAAICFAVLDGFAVFTHLAPHGDNFAKVVAVYFGIYTAFTLIIGYFINKQDLKEKSVTKDTALQEECEHQRKRAQKAENELASLKASMGNRPAEPAPASDKPAVIVEQPKPRQLQLSSPEGFTAEQMQQILSVKRSFNRLKDEERRKEKINTIEDEKVKVVITQIYFPNGI